MPHKPKHPCAYPGCPELTDARFCVAHAKEEGRVYERYIRNPETSKRYNSVWRRIRAAYLSAHPLCEMCLLEGRYIPAQHVHHRRELSDGGTHDYNNLQSLCMSHHSSVHMSKKNTK